MDVPGYEDDPPIEHSSLERRFTKDGIAVDVLIYRVPTIDKRWTLEVENARGDSYCWDETFTSAQEAYDVFLAEVHSDGIRSFVEEPTKH